MESLRSISEDLPLWMMLLFLIYGLWFIFNKVEHLVWKIPPGPIGIPLLGYVFFSKYIYKDMARANKIYGKICSVKMLTRRLIIVSDYDTAKQLLSHPATLYRPEGIYDFVPGNAGFSTMEGQEWLMERKCIMQALKGVGLGKELWDIIIQDDVEKILGYIAASKGQPIDVHPQLSLSAMCNMLALVMGRSFVNALSEDDLTVMFEGNKAFKEQFQNMAISAVFPWLRRYLVEFNIAGYGQREKAVHLASDIIRKAITESLKSETEGDRKDFLAHYSEQKSKHATGTAGDISEESLIGSIASVLATSDTAMAATLWMLYMMAFHDKIQANVHAEIDKAVGRNVSIKWEDRSKLPYTMACIYEMERWIVVVPVFPPRRAAQTFMFHGYTIPKGSMIVANGWALNRDPKYWDNPDEYIPERFLHTSSENISTRKGYGPFSFGKRNCPGERIAVMIVYLYFVGIMQKFKVRTPTGQRPDLTPQYNAIHEPKYQDLCFIERE